MVETSKISLTDETKEAGAVVSYVVNRFRIGLGTNIFIIGLSGTGKSSTSIRLAELIAEKRDKGSNIYVVDSLIKLLEVLINSKIGDIVVIEEVSVLFPSRRAVSLENVSVGAIFDTIRKKQLCLISNCPLWNSVDSHMKALGNLLIETLQVFKGKGLVLSKFHGLQTNPGSGKTYKHTFQKDGFDVKLMVTRMPNEERWKEYEKQKDDFIINLYTKIKEKHRKKMEKEDGIKPIRPIIKQLTPRELQVHQLVNVKRLTQLEASKEMGVHLSRVGRICQNLKKKLDLPRKSERIDVINRMAEPFN